MSKKRTSYSAEFKTRLVLEVLKNERTLNEIASSNNVTPKNIQNWKKTFLDNAEIAMEPSRAVKEYKKEIENLKTENETYAKIVGKLTVERDWLTKKVRSLDSSKEHLVTSKLPNLSITRQCELIGLSRSKLYYKPRLNEKKTRLLKEIHNIFKETPIYGYNKVRQKLLEKVIHSVVLVSREEIQNQINLFLEAQRKHMNLEEEQLFPLIKETLTEEDWQNLEETKQQQIDPLFGDSIDGNRYEKLYQSIKKQGGIK